ncbi:MAG TPA: hypothetical protein VGL17_14635, partial [Gemmatimonadaceae bacterium]
EGTTTTPFDMTVLNDIDRFHLAEDVIRRTGLASTANHVIETIHEKLAEHSRYICEHGEDMPEIRDWRWSVRAEDSA